MSPTARTTATAPADGVASTAGDDPSNATGNTALVSGVLTADARVTELADGSTVHNFELRCADTVVPVAWYDAARPPRLEAGAAFLVLGRVRRRWFRAGGGSQSRTELVAEIVARPGSAGARRAVDRARSAWSSIAGPGS